MVIAREDGEAKLERTYTCYVNYIQPSHSAGIALLAVFTLGHLPEVGLEQIKSSCLCRRVTLNAFAKTGGSI